MLIIKPILICLEFKILQSIKLKVYNKQAKTTNKMVVQSILEAVLSKYLDKWFYGITRENIKAEVLKGRFVISNIGLRDSIFINTNMPYDLRHSYVEKIQLNINWTSNERVVSISINKIYAVLSIKEEEDPDAVLLELKKSGIKEHINELLNKKEPISEEQEKKGGGGISGFLKKLLDNVNISIKSIHLRFEDKVKKYSFGLRVYQIEIMNVDERQNPEFFNREKNKQNYINYRLTIDPLQIYFNPNETQFLCTKDYAQITNQMILMDNCKQVDAHSTTMFNGIGQWGQNKFIYILTISVKGILKRYIKRESIDIPQYQCNITFKSIESNISDLQFHVLLSIIHEVSRYQEILQSYNSRVEISPRKQRGSNEILSLLRIKTTKKEKKVIKEMTQKHLSWVFKEAHVEILKKKFVRMVYKKEITIQNLFGNRDIENIIRRIEIYRIKQWIQICFQVRKRYEKEKPIIFKNNPDQQIENFELYYEQQIQRLQTERQKQIQSRKKDEDMSFFIEERQQVQKEIVLKLTVEINKLQIKISKDNLFGVRALMKNTKLDILKRRNNFKLELAIQDLVAEVFKLGLGQKYPTYVPILKKNVQFQNVSRQNLLQIQFEKSPIGKPFVFSETKINFHSIQITIYAEVFSNLFELFFNDNKNEGNPNPQQIKKKKVSTKQQQTNERSYGVSFQQNIIEGFIQSPWIIIPLSHTNDTSKDCWVIRLGDLEIETPLNESSAKLDDRIFYERFLIGLKAFELKYFTSIDYFYIWLEYENNLQKLKKLPGFADSKHIDLISPISCSVDFLILKRHVSPAVKKSKQAFSARIKIEKVFIRLPKQLLDKLKQKVDVFADEKRNQDFIETNPKNIEEENTIEGEVVVSNQKFKDITLYAILKGYFIYFFFRDSRDEVLFTTDVRDTTIRLTSDHHTFINEGKQKKLKLLLKQKQKHAQWKKSMNQLIYKRDRINDRTFSQVISLRQQYQKIKKRKPHNNFIQEISQSESHKSELAQHKQEINKIVQQQETLLSLNFVMQSLSIQLIDQKQEDFLLCMFQKTKFSYSNVNEKLINFSILEWKILEKQTLENMKKEKRNQKSQNGGQQNQKSKKNIPFLSCKRLFKSKRTKNEAKKEMNQEEQQESNFLLVKAFYNQITGQLSQIQIKVDQLFISWNIPIFNKILRFFFYSAEMADAPTAPSTQKRSLLVKFNMQKFYLYCFHDEELIALLKLHEITIDYSQSNHEQRYLVNCQKFEMDKYEDNDENKQVPMIICPKKLQTLSKRFKRKKSYDPSQNQSAEFRDSSNPGNSNFFSDEVKQSTNPMFLSYVVRRQNTGNKQLKAQLGQDILISQLNCTWTNFVIYFDQQQTIRLINYFISQILGTVASKFKKKQYSLNYISETLRLKKATIFDVSLTNFIVMLTPHSRKDHYFEAKVQKVSFTKNNRFDQKQYKPRLIKVPTKRNQVSLFYETMVFDITKINTYYHFKHHPVEKLAKSAFDVNVAYSKLNFSREYEPILNNLEDIDRTVKVNVKILPGFKLEFEKIVFLTLLQIFYQNIKHRDGKADKFETPHPQPALKIYQIDLGSVCISMYEYGKCEQLQILKHSKKMGEFLNREKIGKQSINFEKEIQVFQQINAKNIKLVYQNQGPNSRIEMKFDQISANGQLPIEKYNPYVSSNLILKMDSVDTQTFLKLLPSNLKIGVNLDKLNQVIQFTNFDSDYVSNKIMPKRKKDSFMTVNVFPENCCCQIGELQLTGNFYITYTKDFKNAVDKGTIRYLFEELGEQKIKLLDQNFIKDQVSDKEIKVNGQNISVFMNKKHIGVLKRLFFGRVEHAAKETNRRFRKQFVVIDGLSAMVNLLELKQLYETYQNHIRKAKNYEDKILLLPSQLVPTKAKSIQKRLMQVQFEKSYVNIMRMLPEKDQKDIPPFMSYMTISFMIPKICLSTYLKQQLISITDLSLKILQYGGKLDNNKILQFIGLRLQYLQNKEEHSKYIEIENAKNIIVNMQNMNQKLFALLAKELASLTSLKSIQKSRNSERKIYTQSLIYKSISQKRIKEELQSESVVQIEEEEFHTTDQFYLIFSNTSSKNMQVIVNNFDDNEQSKTPKEIKLHSKEAKVIKYSGIKMLEFLDQSSKQKNKMTQICFKQDGSGPIVRKTMKQILFHNQIQLFSWCSLKYNAIPNGIKMEIIEPYSVINMTQKPIFICLLDKKKKLLHNRMLLVDSNSEVYFSNIQSYPSYFILSYTQSRSQIQVENYQLIRIDQLASNLAPKKIGPVHAYPSSLMEVIRWEIQSRSNSNRLKLIIFNRFRLQNNLPVSVEANFTTIQCFRQGIVQSSTPNSKNQPSLIGMKIRIDSVYEIQCNLAQACDYLVPHLNEQNSKPKKKQTQLKEHIIFSDQKNSEICFKIWSRCKVGYTSIQKYGKGFVSIGHSPQSYKRISFTIQNFIYQNQIVIALTCSRIIKNAIEKSDNKLSISWHIDSTSQKISKNKASDYWMVPSSAQGVLLQLQQQKERLRPELIRFSQISVKQSKILWNRFIFSSLNKSIAKQVESLYIIEDLCTIQNKTSHIMQAVYKATQAQDDTFNRITIYPNCKANIPIQRPEGQKLMGQHIQINAYCKNTTSISNYHLKCTIKLELEAIKPGIVQAQDQVKNCSLDVMYWSLNPDASYMSKQHKKYESKIVKVTKKVYSYCKVNKYQLLFQSQKQAEEQTSYGYKFINNLPKNYSVLIRQEKGTIPEYCTMIKDYERYYQNIEMDKQMMIPFDIDDDLPSLQMSHKKFSNNISQRVNSIPEMEKKQSKGNRLEISRQNNLNSSRSKIVEYSIEPQNQIRIGLTNLKKIPKKSPTFTVEIYKTNNNLQFDQFFEIKINEAEMQTKQITIKQDVNKQKLTQFEGSEFPQSDSANSVKLGKKTLQVISKKKSSQANLPKYKQHKVKLLIHKKNDESYQFFIQSQDLASVAPKSIEQPIDYKRSLELKIFQISLAIQVTNNPKDILTFQLQNLKLNQVKAPPSSHSQQIDLKIDNLLIKAGRNSSLLQMLHMNRRFLSVQALIEKTMAGNKIDSLVIKLEPTELNVREEILFKILGRIVELRNRYFFYGKKLDQSLNADNRQIKALKSRQTQSIFLANKKSQILSNFKFKSKLQEKFLLERQNFFVKQVKKLNPKILVMKNLNIADTRIYFSFSKDQYAENRQHFIHDPIIKYFILIPTISELKINIPSIEVDDFKGTSKQLGKLVLKKIRHNIGGTILSSLSSLSVLDSPVAAIDGVFQYLEAILMINSS